MPFIKFLNIDIFGTSISLRQILEFCLEVCLELCLYTVLCFKPQNTVKLLSNFIKKINKPYAIILSNSREFLVFIQVSKINNMLYNFWKKYFFYLLEKTIIFVYKLYDKNGLLNTLFSKMLKTFFNKKVLWQKLISGRSKTLISWSCKQVPHAILRFVASFFDFRKAFVNIKYCLLIWNCYVVLVRV